MPRSASQRVGDSVTGNDHVAKESVGDKVRLRFRV